jgi:hypothetical protein
MKELIKSEIESAVVKVIASLEPAKTVNPSRYADMVRWTEGVARSMYRELEALRPTDFKVYHVVDTKTYLNAFRMYLNGLQNHGDSGQRIFAAIVSSI